MMKRLIMVGATLLVFTSMAAIAGEQTITLEVEKMTCALCPITVTKAIERINGVKQVSVDYDAKQAAVRYDDTVTTSEKIAEASTNAGYPASKVE